MSIEPFLIFKVLSGEARIKIIEILKAKGPLGSKEIADLLGMTPAAVSQHLKILKHHGILRSKRHGYWIPYFIDAGALDKCRRVVEHVCSCGDFHTRQRNHSPQDEIPDEVDELTREKERLENELHQVSERIEKMKNRR